MTLKQIAEQLNLSVHTVSDILNCGDMRYSEKTRRRVLETAEKVGYRVNRQARVLRGGRSGIIGMIKGVHLMETSSERVLFAGEAIHKAGYELFSSDIFWHLDGLSRAVNAMIDARVEGVVLSGLAPGIISEKAIQRLIKSKIPMVAMGSGGVPGVPYVSADFYSGASLLTQHLLDLGYRCLAMISGNAPEDRAISRRVAGFRDTAAKAGIPEEDAAIVIPPPCEGIVQPGAGNYLPGRLAMLEILKGRELPQAILCSNDHYAIAAMQACTEAGIKVPEEIAIVGFDNTSGGQFITPSVTTVSQPTQLIAQTSVDLLLRQIRGEKLSAKEALCELPCELVIRKSCGATLRSLGNRKKKMTGKR